MAVPVGQPGLLHSNAWGVPYGFRQAVSTYVSLAKASHVASLHTTGGETDFAPLMERATKYLLPTFVT